MKEARIGITVVLLLFAAGSLAVVLSVIGSAPVRDNTGAVVFDEYQRAKDILAVILPLVTTALGYWFGAAGRDHAEAKAAQAEADRQKTSMQLKGVLDTSNEQGLLEKAKEIYPEAFAPTGSAVSNTP